MQVWKSIHMHYLWFDKTICSSWEKGFFFCIEFCKLGLKKNCWSWRVVSSVFLMKLVCCFFCISTVLFQICISFTKPKYLLYHSRRWSIFRILDMFLKRATLHWTFLESGYRTCIIWVQPNANCCHELAP